MPTPYNVESSVTNLGQPLALFQGPFKRGANWYVAVDDFLLASSAARVGVFKSLDDGVTWAPKDQTHEYPYKNNTSVFETRTHGNTLSFAFYNVALNEIDLGTFDLSTDLFSAAITGGPAGPFLTGGNGEKLLHGRLSNGNFVVVWEKSLAGNKNALYAALYNGAWQTPVLIQSTGTAFLYIELLGLVVDDADRVHILRRDNEGGNVIYCQFVAGAVGADTTIGAVGTSVRMGRGLYLASTDEIVFPMRGGGLPQLVNLLRGGPANAPVFTIDPVADPSDAIRFVRIAMPTNESALYFFLYDTDPTPSAHETITYYVQNGLAGAWSGPTLFWDEILDPPTPPQDFFDDQTPFSVIIADSPLAIAMTAGMFQDSMGAGSFCGVQFFIQGPLTQALALACPLTATGTLGVAYDDFLIRTAGTAPFTFAIISGALPPGLVLNTATGEISGIPTAAGIFNYVARVTDATGLTADTPGCPLTIVNPALALLCPVLQSGTVGNPFTGQLLASGGTPPYTFSIIAGSLPPGFTLNPVTGTITGIAAIVGSYSFTARVTDSLGATADSSACPITITICISAKSQIPVDPPPVFGGAGEVCGMGETPARSQLP